MAHDFFWTCGPLKRTGMTRYVHIIRGPYDPQRSDRKARKGQETAWRDVRKKTSAKEWEPLLLQHLADGEPRTFNRMMVELLDQEADMNLEGPTDVALWQLVTSCQIEHTDEAPIYFRVKGSTKEPAGKPGQMARAPQAQRDALTKRHGLEWVPETDDEWAPDTTLVTDEAERQKLLNALAEGKMILKSGKKGTGAKMTSAELAGVRRSVENTERRLGMEPAPASSKPEPAKKPASRAKAPKKPISPAPTIPESLIAQSLSRKELQAQGYSAVSKSSDLRPFGYQIVIWLQPKTMTELFEYVPQESDPRTRQAPGARVTVTKLEQQRLFHEAIGAPLPQPMAPRKRRQPPAAKPAKEVTPKVTPQAFAADIVEALGLVEAETFALDRALASKLAFWVEVYAAILKLLE